MDHADQKADLSLIIGKQKLQKVNLGHTALSLANMVEKRSGVAVGNSWAETAGTGGRSGAWGLSGVLGSMIAWVGTVLLVVCCPAITILL
jgi:hypothetical protein